MHAAIPGEQADTILRQKKNIRAVNFFVLSFCPIFHTRILRIVFRILFASLALCVHGSPIDGKTVSFYDIMKYMTDESFDEACPRNVGVEAAYFTRNKFIAFRNIKIVLTEQKTMTLISGSQMVVSKLS